MVNFWFKKTKNLIKQLQEEIKSNLKEAKVSLRGGPLPVPGRPKALNFIYYPVFKIKNLILFSIIVARVVAKHLVMSKIGETILDFLKNHRVFLTLSSVLISFIVEIFLVQKLAYGQLI